ncbi:MAG: polysaccharide lyase family 7 protein [Polyangiaceae bacterium]|nr:polysaccharide lyase family 7 protein [Polyangiaceae bacterium]
MMKRIIGGFATLACLAPVACNNSGTPSSSASSYPENVGELSQALTCSTYYLKHKANNMYASIDPGSATTRAGNIKFNQSGTASAARFIKEPAGTGKFKFQTATGPFAGFYMHEAKDRMAANGTYPFVFSETACELGYVAWQDQQTMMGVKMETDTMLSNNSSNMCGNVNNEVIWEAAASVTCPPAPGTSGSSTNTNAPATYYDMSKWKITLPVDKFNELKPTDIFEFELPNWYDTNFFWATGGKMIFKSPNEGWTTANSKNARSELRMMLRAGNTTMTEKDPKNNFVLSTHSNKTAYGMVGAQLQGTVAVNAVADSGCLTTIKSAHSVVVGQIHGLDDTAIQPTWGIGNEPLKIFYKKLPGHAKGSVFWTYELNVPKDDPNRGDYCTAVWGNCWDNNADPGAAGVSLGEEFTYVVQVVNSTMTLTFSRAGGPTVTQSKNLATAHNAFDNPQGYAQDSFYFKAGVYNQSNTVNDGNSWSPGCHGAGQSVATQYANGDYAQATFSNLYHGPVGSMCGNGVKEGSEACDDGNTVNNDACTNSCLAATCSDGAQNNGEAGVDCGGSCTACSTGTATTYDAGSGWTLANGAFVSAGWATLEDVLNSSIEKTNVVAGNSITVRYKGGAPGMRLSLYVNGTIRETKVAPSSAAADLVFTQSVSAGQSIKFSSPDAVMYSIDYVTISNSGGSTAVCGNGVVQAPEACDDGNTVVEACAYGLTSCTVCGSTCTNVSGTTSYCGNGVVASGNGEQCDDGNQVNTDACSNTCKTPTCSDGIKNGTETSTDCGGVSGGVTCAACATAVCGNGILQSPEQCDDGNTVTEGCTYGLTSCTVCSATCSNVAGAVTRCGDTVVQSGNGEQCDDGNAVNTDACSNICKTPTCTDGIKNGTESSTDCGGVSGGVTCAACPTGGTTYQAEAMVINGGGIEGTAVWLEDANSSYLQQNSSAAGTTSVTVRYDNSSGLTGKRLGLYVNGVLKENKAMATTNGTMSDLVFNHAVPAGQSVRVQNTDGISDVWIDWVKVQ